MRAVDIVLTPFTLNMHLKHAGMKADTRSAHSPHELGIAVPQGIYSHLTSSQKWQSARRKTQPVRWYNTTYIRSLVYTIKPHHDRSCPTCNACPMVSVHWICCFRDTRRSDRTSGFVRCSGPCHGRIPSAVEASALKWSKTIFELYYRLSLIVCLWYACGTYGGRSEDTSTAVLRASTNITAVVLACSTSIDFTEWSDVREIPTYLAPRRRSQKRAR